MWKQQVALSLDFSTPSLFVVSESVERELSTLSSGAPSDVSPAELPEWLC